MNMVKIIVSIPLVCIGSIGIVTFLAGDNEGLVTQILCAAIGTLIPGVCLLVVGIKNFTGRENPVADTAIQGAAVMVVIICTIVFFLNGAIMNTEAAMDMSRSGQPENIDGIEWVLYFGEIDTNKETKETEAKQFPKGEKYWIKIDVAEGEDCVYISNNSYFDLQNVKIVVDREYTAFKDAVTKGENRILWSEFSSGSGKAYSWNPRAEKTLDVHIGDIYVDDMHFSGTDYNMDFFYATDAVYSGDEGRIIGPKN